MANSWFQFKQFRVEQGQCGMKISTDACILGAIAAKVVQLCPPNSIGLDIGAGTGLLSLMMAQECKLKHIDAVEIDEHAFIQAQYNVAQSPWANSIRVWNNSIQQFANHNSDQKYNFIISNPPFFAHHLPSTTSNRNMARHEVTLTRTDLLHIINDFLDENSWAVLLYPATDLNSIILLATELNINVLKVVKIFPNYNKEYNRVVIIINKNSGFDYVEKLNFIDDKLFIRNELGYTEQYLNLLSPYYL